MRIVQVVENLDKGGLERVALDLALGLQRRGHDVSFVCLLGPGTLASEAEARGIPVAAFQKPPGFSIPVLLRIASHLRGIRPDVVHTHNPGVHHYAAVAGKMAGTRCMVSTRHAPMSSTGETYNERYFRMTARWTHRVFYVSDHTRSFLMDAGKLPAKEGGVVVNGIPLERFAPRTVPVASHWPALRFGTLGRMVPVKGHSILLQAFARIAPELPAATLSITGGGELQKALEAQVRELKLESRVAIEANRSDVPAVLAGLDVFVFPSLSEGLPLVILEAMASGLPIVSTRVGGVPEVAPENVVAWYCQPNDVDGLAKAMLDAARSRRELERRSAVARSHAVERYGIETMVDRYEQAYREVLKD